MEITEKIKHKTSSLFTKVIASRYRYLRVLGTGGMGEVHLVKDEKTGQHLAMKCCPDQGYGKRFEREVLSWMKLGKHPNVVTAIFFDWIASIPTLFIEYVEGSNLREVINDSAEKKQDLPIEAVFDYSIQICRGMMHLHRNGIIHRDLKPSNILLAQEQEGFGIIKISDMGLSKVKGSMEPESPSQFSENQDIPADLTQTRDLLGTPQYMSPQQYAYSKGVGEETDVYAFGIILYEMLTQGKKPFDADNSQGWFYAHTYAAPKPIKSQISSRFRFSIFQSGSRKALYNLVMQCLSKKTRERPQSFREIEEQLLKLHQKMCGKEYGRYTNLQNCDLSPQEMNNQAISLLEMGAEYTREGWEKLEKICAVYPDYMEAHLNKLLFQLKKNQCSLGHFWHHCKKWWVENQEERQRIVELLVGGSLEKGCYCRQSMLLLESMEEIERLPSLIRLKAKWLYLTGHYSSAIELFAELCRGEYCHEEDFYHWGGAVIYSALKKQKARLCLDKQKFSVELDREIKQKVWYILRDGEQKCGASKCFERGRDISIGASLDKKPFWHEYGLFAAHKGEVRCVATSSDQTYALSGGTDYCVRLWDISQRKEICCFREHTAPITGVAIDTEGRYGISGSQDSTVRVWDLEKGEMLGCYDHRAPVTAVTLGAKSGLTASCSINGIVRVWNLKQLWQKRKLWNFWKKKQQCHFTINNGVTTMALTIDGSSLLAGCQDGTVLFWDLAAGSKSPSYLQGHNGNVTRVAVSADGKWAVSTSDSLRDNIFVWDLQNKEKLLSFSGTKRGIHSLAIASNAHWILVAANDSSIHVWNLRQRKKVAVLEGHSGRICDLTATFQGSLALSAGSDGNIHIWTNSFVCPLLREQKYLKALPQ